jgi:hypothetical protein
MTFRALFIRILNLFRISIPALNVPGPSAADRVIIQKSFQITFFSFKIECETFKILIQTQLGSRGKLVEGVEGAGIKLIPRFRLYDFIISM